MSDNSFYNIINSQFKEDEDLTSLINTTISKLMLDLRVNIVIANSNACVSGDYIFGKAAKSLHITISPTLCFLTAL